jgi:BirA family biotin operon repressor/biotin-[acetyl-CoA-carboxylase] ligase
MTDTRRALLDALEGDTVRGPDLAERLGVSRAAVWKQVEALREEGVGIESTGEGYAVTDLPEFGGAAVEFGLDAPFAVEFHETIPSTNDRAREAATEDGAADLAVVAAEQSAGKGRLDRAWSAPAGGIYCSLVLRPDRPPAHAPVYTLAAAVAVTRAAREAGVDAIIKWPNDVLVHDDSTARGGKKLCGVLTEMEGEADRVAWLVVGIGVNANIAADDLPEGATSLLEERGEPVERRVFLQRVLEQFHELRNDPDSVLDAWREHATTLGQRVRVDTPGGKIVGDAVDVAFPGALLVETDDSERKRVTAGDCEHLRPV